MRRTPSGETCEDEDNAEGEGLAGDAAVFIEVTSEKGGFTTRAPCVKRAKTG